MIAERQPDASTPNADMAGEVAVRLDGLTKRFGAVRATENLSLTLRRGETVALLGPNGAGKTTTISLLLGLLAPDSGTVSVLGMAPTAAIRSGRIGAMLQDGSLMPGVRIGELLDYALSLSGHPTTRDELLATAGLDGLEKRRVDRLSGGQTQRVRFALAIASQPDILVLDEPTAAMDVEARHEFWATMRAYTAAGRTVLFATHYLEEAETFASRVVIISRGQVVADGTVAALENAITTRMVQVSAAGAGAAGEAGEAFARLPGVRAVSRTGDRYTLETSDADATVRALAASQMPWHGLEVRGASLDDVFLALVGNGGADNADNADNAGDKEHGGAR